MAKEYSRTKELTFLITIINDLAHNYKNHNKAILEELIANLRYKKEKEIEISRSKELKKK